MIDPTGTRPPADLASQISVSLTALWTEYAGKPPTTARTEIRGNVVTTSLIDAVDDLKRNMRRQVGRDHAAPGNGRLTTAAYEREAVAAVGRLTRQRVKSLSSSRDLDTNVATEVFQLDESLVRGRPREPHAESAPGPPPSGRRARLRRPSRAAVRN